jgi:IclR family KDG regulon transcriptional repressor
MRREASKNKYPVKSLVKALRILDVLAERPAGFGITELSEALHIGKSTVHRLLATLKEEGYVVTHPAGSRYILGGRIARLGQQLSDQYQLLTFGVPVIRRLAREYNETVNLALLEGTEIVYIAGEESRETLRVPLLTRQLSAKSVYRRSLRKRFAGGTRE